MASNVRPVNLVNFTGGLNLRGDAFELGEGESPDMLNVDIDRRGGFVARRGWTRWNSAAVTQLGTWNPRTLYVHELADGTDRVWLANNSLVGYTTSGTFTKLLASATDVVATAMTHGADFAPWGDSLYIACGRANQSVVVNSALTATRLTAAGAGQWTAYATPSTTVGPKADFFAPHMGYMFAASTVEDGTTFQNRVRWSHPNNPGAWLQADFVDLNEGGGPITGLIPMRDHLLIFKQSAVWAIFGYDADTWQVVNVSRERGAVTRQAIARAEGSCFFYSHLEGIYSISDGNAPVEVSGSLRPMFSDGNFGVLYEDYVWLGWVGQRLYFAAPYTTTAAATDARSVFVFDPSIGNGAWMLYKGSDDYGVGPFAQGGFGGGAGQKLACARSVNDVMKLEANDQPIDNFGGTNAGFSSYYVTGWVDAGAPTQKKQWRRPDLVMKERDSLYTATVEMFRDYDEANVSRVKTLSIPAGGTSSTWGDGSLWGDGDIYGPPAKGSTVARSGSLGAARAVQLKISGQSQKPWGVDAVVLKFIPRRLR